MYTYEHQLRIRYADTDKMGYAYYGNYSRYYEIARVESLRTLGIRYSDLEDRGVIMPVLENFSKYIKPATYDELITIKLMVKKFPGVRVKFEYEFYNEQDEIIHIGHTVLVFVDRETGKVTEMPEEIRNVLKPFFNEE